MFTNPYDAQLSADSARRKEMRDVAKMDAYDYHAYQAGLSSQEAGRALGGMLGMQTPEQAKQAKIEEIMGQYGEGAKSYEQLMQIADSFRDAGMLDLWEQTMGMAKDMKGKVSTTQEAKEQELEDAYLYVASLGGPLTELEKRYFKARIKKDVSIGIDSKVIDTAPTVYNEIIARRKNQVSDSGEKITDTGETGASDVKARERLDTKVTSLAGELNNIGGVESALSQLERRISKYRDAKTGKLIGDIPGLSEWETWTRGPEGNAISALWENLIGEVRHERFGSVLTANEQKMFEKIKTGNPLYLPDTAVLEYITNMRETVDNQKNKIRKGYAKDVVSEYDSRGNVASNDLQDKIKAALDAGHTMEQIKRFLGGQ